MNNLDLLNFLGKLDYEVIKLTDLEKNSKQLIKQFRAVETVYGRRILAVFTTGKAVWLPERFKDLPEEFLESVNKGEKLMLTFIGKKKISTGREINEIEFESVK